MSKIKLFAEDHAHKIAEALWISMPTIDQTAGEAGQSAQDPDVERGAWCDGVAIAVAEILEQFAKRLVILAAKQCNGRADVEDRAFAIRAEARKCADQIRHNLLCDDGEHICYSCDGDGCYKCQYEGIQEGTKP